MTPIDDIPYRFPISNRTSIIDSEELTALELAGRTTEKVNEVIALVNTQQADIDTREKSDDITNNRKLSPTGDFTGTLNGYSATLVQSDITAREKSVDITNNRKLSPTGDFTGSWFGLTNPIASEPGIQNQVDANTQTLNDNILVTAIPRQDPATGIWSLLDDVGHMPQHIASITQDENQITITYDQTFDKIKDFGAKADDVLNQTGLVFGGDVGTGFANITIGKPAPISAFVSVDGTGNLTVTDGVGITSIDYGITQANVITITHEKTLKPTTPAICISHQLTTKFDVVPYDFNDTLSKFMLVRKKKETSALMTATNDVFSSGSAVTSDNGYSQASFTAGDLVINTPTYDGFVVQITCGQNIGALGITANVKSITSNTVTINFYDSTGTLLTTIPDGFFFIIRRENVGAIPDALVTGDIAFFFQRESLMSGVRINPSTPMPAGNNIWVSGIFKKA